MNENGKESIFDRNLGRNINRKRLIERFGYSFINVLS